MSYTTRDPKAAPAPDPERIHAAAEQGEIARQALLKMARHLDASPTRRLHIDVTELREAADRLSIRLTEFVDG